jgi:hypothetical protein
MRVESEKTLEKRLSREIKKLGGWSIKMLSTHIRGLPDRLCLLPGGILFFAEIKTTKKEPSPIQRLIHRKLRKLGFRVEVIDTSAQIASILKDYDC